MAEYALCRAWGDPHYRAFNGKTFDYQGMCKYTLAAPCVENGDFFFKIVGVNKVAKWNKRVSYNRGMEIKIEGSVRKYRNAFKINVLLFPKVVHTSSKTLESVMHRYPYYYCSHL